MSHRPDLDSVLVPPKPAPPKTSWWVGLQGDRFSLTAREEAERMNHQTLPPAAAKVVDQQHAQRMRRGT